MLPIKILEAINSLEKDFPEGVPIRKVIEFLEDDQKNIGKYIPVIRKLLREDCIRECRTERKPFSSKKFLATPCAKNSLSIQLCSQK